MTPLVLDSSAVIAILASESEAEAMTAAIDRAPWTTTSAATLVECGVVADHRGPEAGRALDRLLTQAQVRIADLTVRQARLARAAHRDYGRGSGHRARLSYGDCFAYALAIDLDQPLLFKGDDFGHTEVRSALADR